MTTVQTKPTRSPQMRRLIVAGYVLAALVAGVLILQGIDALDGGLDDSRVAITAAEYGDAWPFTVAEGELACVGEPGRGAVIFAAGNQVYAINGTAKSTSGYADVAPIWLPDGDDPAARKNLTPILNRGLELCGG